jgi:dolichol-phosphate mannosyltransferase
MTDASSANPERRIVVVIAALDEAENIEEIYTRLRRALLALPATRSEFVWVIEGTDGTADILRRLSQREAVPASTIIEPPRRRGLGAAFKLGFAAVPEGAGIVVTMDADLNHHPEQLKRLLDVFEAENADIVIGSRQVEGAEVRSMAVWRSLASGTVNWFLRRLSRAPVQDLSSGYRLYRASALRRLRFESDGFAFQPEIVLQALANDMRIVEVPITFTQRRSGRSKLYVGETAGSYLRLFAGRLARRG